MRSCSLEVSKARLLEGRLLFFGHGPAVPLHKKTGFEMLREDFTRMSGFRQLRNPADMLGEEIAARKQVD
ncbi:MAG: hypothetical protein C4520_00065 [Candidatus Abyssobacteria bacterium SURF_5]|uniref:Uncharacterized protein n=1 Tax=Abyssobacteria bacterium (strain SURF_5) TaxID=2093360 RepID=A0A3A4PBS8_ABYX5|nr:MAG: hypothetical protein C4520_00065 [Candidatus Abyssubacteria bacterium SURF_5]